MLLKFDTYKIVENLLYKLISRSKAITRIFLLNIILLFTNPFFLAAQTYKCPFGEVDCPGRCGRFVDTDNDGFCDYGLLSKKINEKKDTVANKKDVIAKTDTAVIDKKADEKSDKKTDVKKSENISKIDAAGDNVIEVDLDKTDSITSSDEVLSENKEIVSNKKRSYSLFTIFLICFALYGITTILHKKGIIRKFVHRRFWNILLLITFLTSAALGLILAIQINYDIFSSTYRDYLYWHVQFGIAMAAISLLHVLWHWKYFVNIFSKKNKSDCVN